MSELFFGAFTVTRRYDARPARVFAAFAHRGIKRRWMGCEEVRAPVIERLDFHVGGREISRGGGRDGADICSKAGFWISFPSAGSSSPSSCMWAAGRFRPRWGRWSTPEGEGTVLSFTEQGVDFGEDGWAEREEGAAVGMDQLGAWLASERKAA